MGRGTKLEGSVNAQGVLPIDLVAAVLSVSQLKPGQSTFWPRPSEATLTRFSTLREAFDLISNRGGSKPSSKTIACPVLLKLMAGDNNEEVHHYIRDWEAMKTIFLPFFCLFWIEGANAGAVSSSQKKVDRNIENHSSSVLSENSTALSLALNDVPNSVLRW